MLCVNRPLRAAHYGVFGRSERPKVDFRKINGGGTQSYLTNNA